MEFSASKVWKVLLSYLKVAFILSQLCFVLPAHALNSYIYLVFQTNDGSLESNLVPLSGSSYDRQNYSLTGVSVYIVDALTSTYNVGIGESWTWRWVQTEDAEGSSVNQLMSSLILTYNGEVGDCENQWSNDHDQIFCGTFNRWWSFKNSQCWPDGKYKIEVTHDGALVGRENFQPTLFVPDMEAMSVTPGSISPFIRTSADGNAPRSSLPAVLAGTANIGIQVTDNLGCGEPLEGITVKLENTIASGSASHKHFTDVSEPGTGEYIASDPPWTYISDDKTSVEVMTDIFGEVNATYKAGFYGVQESITAEVTHPTNGETISAEVTLDIKADLVPLNTSGLYYTLRGSFGTAGRCNDQAHNDAATLRRSHYVTPEMRTRVLEMSDRFYFDTGIRLSFNDASLEYGGFFDDGTGGRTDVGSNRCHLTHRQGVDIDVNVGSSLGCPHPYNLNCLANVSSGIGAKMTRKEVLNRIVEIDMVGHKWREGPLHYRFIDAVN
ncbi:hypothetical protein JYT31_03160 [Beggiatoa alba]|nr:hypothetical protein [Beggiatoa alba]